MFLLFRSCVCNLLIKVQRLQEKKLGALAWSQGGLPQQGSNADRGTAPPAHWGGPAHTLMSMQEGSSLSTGSQP